MFLYLMLTAPRGANLGFRRPSAEGWRSEKSHTLSGSPSRDSTMLLQTLPRGMRAPAKVALEVCNHQLKAYPFGKRPFSDEGHESPEWLNLKFIEHANIVQYSYMLLLLDATCAFLHITSFNHLESCKGKFCRFSVLLVRLNHWYAPWQTWSRWQ